MYYDRRIDSASQGSEAECFLAGCGKTLLVCLVHLVYLVDLVQPNKRDKPNKPNNSLIFLADFFSILLEVTE
jgi:hypothetical protein